MVAMVLGAVAAFSGRWVEVLGAVAVLFSFLSTQVNDRLAEREAARATPEVHCHRWSLRYFLVREAAWATYFCLNHTWTALIGVFLFLAYPAWRKWWRRRHPLKETPMPITEVPFPTRTIYQYYAPSGMLPDGLRGLHHLTTGIAPDGVLCVVFHFFPAGVFPLEGESDPKALSILDQWGRDLIEKTPCENGPDLLEDWIRQTLAHLQGVPGVGR